MWLAFAVLGVVSGAIVAQRVRGLGLRALGPTKKAQGSEAAASDRMERMEFQRFLHLGGVDG
jgi:hypothetical protein